MIYFLFPQLRKLSGAERLILRLAAHTAELGGAVTIVTHYFDEDLRPALDSRVQLIATGTRPNFFHNHYLDAPFEYIYSIRLLAHIGAEAGAIIFFGPPSLPALLASRWFQRTTVPRLYFCYEPPRFIYDDARAITARLGALGILARPSFALYKLLDAAMARRADGLLANSEFGAARLRAAYGRPATVITHGVDIPPATRGQIEMVRARFLLDARCVLLTVNFLHPRKRLDLFLRALSQLRMHAPQAIGLIVGSGPEELELKALAHELGLEGAAIFTGFVSEEELAAYYAVADLYVHTGKLESFGLSVLEASAAGVPVVSVNEGGPREIIVDGQTGALVDANPEALAASCLALLQDPPRRAAMGAAARQRALEKYSWNRGAETLLEVVSRNRDRVSVSPLE